jgi:CMP-2-keto-3-deoxyoctulosonic acid synthetase
MARMTSRDTMITMATIRVAPGSLRSTATSPASKITGSTTIRARVVNRAESAGAAQVVIGAHHQDDVGRLIKAFGNAAVLIGLDA